jgi:hypothetical protein
MAVLWQQVTIPNATCRNGQGAELAVMNCGAQARLMVPFLVPGWTLLDMTVVLGSLTHKWSKCR